MTREKIIHVMNNIVAESKNTRPYVVVAQPKRVDRDVAQKLDTTIGQDIGFTSFGYGYFDIIGKPIDLARNYLIEQAIASGAKYLLFVGEDTVLPYSGFYQLHDTAEQYPGSCVVGVYYVKLGAPMVMLNDDGWVHPIDPTPGQIIRNVWQAGMDAMLIPTEVLRRMKAADAELPYCCVWNEEGHPFVGEDNFFYHRLRQIGSEVICNTDVQCLHVDIPTGKYTAYPDVDLSEYRTQIEITEPLVHSDLAVLTQHSEETMPK